MVRGTFLPVRGWRPFAAARLARTLGPKNTAGAARRFNMNSYLVAAAGIAFLVGLVHSILGERLIFQRLREGGVVPTKGGTLLGEGHVRILWASWHVLTVFGWGIAVILLWLAFNSLPGRQADFIQNAIAISMLCGAGLVFVGTRAKHPGWLGLLGVAALAWFGSLA